VRIPRGPATVKAFLILSLSNLLATALRKRGKALGKDTSPDGRRKGLSQETCLKFGRARELFVDRECDFFGSYYFSPYEASLHSIKLPVHLP
jgi:hypothetical protein